MAWLWFLLGGLAGSICTIAAGQWGLRRVWRTARKLAARARGQQHLAELAQLTGGLAHEIKNPLSTINVNLQLLAEDLARHQDEDHRRWLRRLQNVQGEADRLREILDDFLRFAGKCEPALAVYSRPAMLAEMTGMLAGNELHHDRPLRIA